MLPRYSRYPKDEEDLDEEASAVAPVKTVSSKNAVQADKAELPVMILLMVAMMAIAYYLNAQGYCIQFTKNDQEEYTPNYEAEQLLIRSIENHIAQVRDAFAMEAEKRMQSSLLVNFPEDVQAGQNYKIDVQIQSEAVGDIHVKEKATNIHVGAKIREIL